MRNEGKDHAEVKVQSKREIKEISRRWGFYFGRDFQICVYIWLCLVAKKVQEYTRN